MSTATNAEAPPKRARAVAALEAVEELLSRAERPDLDKRVKAAKARLAQTGCNVLVVGEFKKGKSTLINALLNAPVCPVDDDVATAKPIEIRHAPEPTAAIVYRQEDLADTKPPVVRTIRFDELPTYASEPPTAPDAHEVCAVRVGLPRQLLGTGLVIVDTPGVGGLGSTHSAITIGALPTADAVLFVTDASQELTASEMEFLRTARALCPATVCVMTKIDFYPHWRRILELNKGHLQRAGMSTVMLPVSSPLRMAAIDQNDRDLNNESGFGELVAVLRDELAARAERASLSRLASELAEMLDHLESQLRTEVAVLDDPEESARLVRQLEGAKEKADRLRGQASRWQQTLNDGSSDLAADVEFDLRARFRDLVRDAEESIDKTDPAKVWEEFEPWLSKQAGAALSANYTLLHERAVALAQQVATHFDTDQQDIVEHLGIEDLVKLEFDIDIRASLKIDKPKLLGNAIAALRGTSGGMVMLSAFASLASIAIAPVAVAAVGVAMGRKMMKDERTRQLTQRKMQAKQAVRKYTDDLMFVAGKDSRDTLRRLNRQLRDFFLSRAEELTASTSESLAAAQQALRSSEQTRVQRKKTVTALLNQVALVRPKIAAINPAKP
ncbi:MAG: dynamin family protein [Acidimicrobiales bacterium]|nr:dynamin family protein [Acidimicrobiales bacterium]